MPDKLSHHALYVILLYKQRSFTEEVIKNHVAHLNELDRCGKLIICGIFTDAEGEIILVHASSRKEVKAIAESDPFVREGFESYDLITLQQACKGNNHLLEDKVTQHHSLCTARPSEVQLRRD